MSVETAPHHCGLYPELVKFTLVALSRLARIVRHKEEAFAWGI